MPKRINLQHLKLLFLLPVLCALLLTSLLPMRSYAAYNSEVEFDSDIVYVESLDQGTVIFNKNANKKTPMASLTKITTAMVVLDNVENLDKKVKVTQAELDELANTNSSTAGISVDEILTIRQLLNLLMVKSANEASVILAHEVAGSTPKFVAMMNEFAKARGCKNTHYVNPHGLDAPGHYTTATDLARLTKYALKNNTFKKIVAQPTYTLAKTNKREETTYPNTNDLLKPNGIYYYKGVRGVKTGTTDEAGQCLVSYATRNGYTYLCIVLSGPKAYAEKKTSNIAFQETCRAYNWVFENIKLKVVAQPSDVVTVVHVNLARDNDYVRLVPAHEVTALIPSNIDASGISLEVIPGSLPDNVKAPLKEGQVIGKANVLYAGEVLTTVDLAAAESVHQSFFGSIGYYLKTFFSYTAVKVLLLLLLIGGAFVWLVNFLYNKNNAQRNVHMIRVKHDVSGDQPLQLVSSDYGKKSKQPKPKKKKTQKGKVGENMVKTTHYRRRRGKPANPRRGKPASRRKR